MRRLFQSASGFVEFSDRTMEHSGIGVLLVIGKAKSFGVGPIGVAIIALEKAGRSGKTSSRYFLCGKVSEPTWRNSSRVPAPNPCRDASRRSRVSLWMSSDVLGAREVYPAETKRYVDEMNMAIDKTRQDQMAACFDHFVVEDAVEFGLFVSDGDDFSIVDSDRSAHGCSLLPVEGTLPRAIIVFGNWNWFPEPNVAVRNNARAQ